MEKPVQLDLFGGGQPAAPAPDYLFFDTETTGLPRSWNAPVTDVDNWPRLVQLAYMSYDREGRELVSANVIIKPEGFTIPADASRIHGITTERALAEGVPLRAALGAFGALLEKARYLVGHNISFDEKIVGAEFLRCGLAPLPANKVRICTMHSSVDYCAIPGPRGNKWPKLVELHSKLFNEEFGGAHNAGADVAATAKCFWELKRRGIIRIPA